MCRRSCWRISRTHTILVPSASFKRLTTVLRSARKRFRVSQVLGFLLIGLSVGPYGSARFVQQHDWLRHLLIMDVDGVRALAELGVVFLLFIIGLELSFERLWAMRRLVFGVGSAQIVLTGAFIATIAWAFGNSVEASVAPGDGGECVR